jgi:hypothetical protein
MVYGTSLSLRLQTAELAMSKPQSTDALTGEGC